MLFNSFEFILLYLPVVACGFFLLARVGRGWATAWLALASLYFYGSWSPRYVALILASICFNYSAGYALSRLSEARAHHGRSRITLATAVAANLLLLAYFKYADFFIGTVNEVTAANWPLLHIILPVGISFFTFTQIAFLVDASRGIAKEYNFVDYVLFVTYFPHLIAGPVLHHKQMMPQFADPKILRFSASSAGLGLTLFGLGLAKKVLLADTFSQYVGPVFSEADRGVVPAFTAAWEAALGYTLQIYFDFSAYSDMAVGLSLVFGIKLPINFYSPYKAWNIIEFWRRWHMTLSQFLRDYLYIPLGGNRRGPSRRYINLMITMLLGGLWHGANWTFVVWGALHGAYLVVNHGWQEARRRLGFPVRETPGSIAARALGVALTFACVVVAWVFFRADSLGAALSVLKGMTDVGGVTRPSAGTAGALLLGTAIALLAPNSMQIVAHVERVLHTPRALAYAAGAAALAALSFLNLGQTSEFLYFQF